MELSESRPESVPSIPWVQCPEIVVKDARRELISWYPEFGFRYVLVIARTGDADNITKYNASSFVLRLNSGRTVTPIGIVPGIQPDFCARMGEPIPSILCTESVEVQHSESPWLGLVYCMEKRDSPAAVMMNGVWNDNPKQRMAVAGEKLCAPPSGGYRFRSRTSLSTAPNYSDREGSMKAFTTFLGPDRQDGLLAVGKLNKYCVVILRIPEYDRASISSIETDSIQAVFSHDAVMVDHAITPCLGLFCQQNTPSGPEYWLLEKAVLTKESFGISAAADTKVDKWMGFVGPSTVFSPKDWKLVLAFEHQPTGALFAVRIGDLRLQLADGTQIYAPKTS